MSACSISSCDLSLNIWSITCSNISSSDGAIVTICNNHLEMHEAFKTIHRALILARYFEKKHSVNSAKSKDWNFQKVVSTWAWSDDYQCSLCNRTDNIWKSVVKTRNNDQKLSPYDKPEFKLHYFCDGHLQRLPYPTFFEIRDLNNFEEGISLLEETWKPL